MHSSFKVTVARKNSTDDQVFVDLLSDLLTDRTAVSDACHAAVTSSMEADFFEEGSQAGLVVVLCDCLGTWGE